MTEVLRCLYCGQANLVVRETYEFPVADDGTATKDTGEPFQEVWCKRCEKRVSDFYGCEYTERGFVVVRLPF